jgi:beta-glucosidase
MAFEETDTLFFPSEFEWGTATASFQIEGGADTRGKSIWDVFCDVPGNVDNGDHGLVACDHYNRFEEDIALMVRFGVKRYRFSLSWPRLYVNGRVNDGVNSSGKEFYNRLINCLIENGITPGNFNFNVLPLQMLIFSFSDNPVSLGLTTIPLY